jgi:hypothetical protein
MKKADLIKKLENQVKVVPDPEHPNVLLGPDILAFNEKKLFGIFFIENERQFELEETQIKLAETSLNYPSKQLNYLVLKDNNIDTNIISKLELLFDKVIDIEDLFNKSLYKEDKNTEQIKTLKEAQLKFQDETSKSYNYNFNLINTNVHKNIEKDYVNIKLRLSKYNKATYSDWISKNNYITKCNIFELENKLIGFKKINNKSSDLKDIEPYYRFGIFNEILFDNKYIHFKHIKDKYLDIDKIPKTLPDPLKLVRVLSNAGWKLTLETSIDNLIKFSSHE